MNTNQCDIGLIGLAVMGENLVLNMESKGFHGRRLQPHDGSDRQIRRGQSEGEKHSTRRARWKSLSAPCKRPRKAMIMVKAGAPVDAVIGQLAPLLEKGDVIIDGGNSLFTDTQRRCKDLEGRGIHFVGCGVSGGEEGALKGPSLMPGGSRESWEIIAPIFTQDRGACRWRALLPLHGAGWRRPLREDGAQRNRVRRHAAHLRSLRDLERRRRSRTPNELADIFSEWNKGDLDSYLIDITSQIFRKIDPDTGKPLVDVILDKAGQKGTGIWTLQSAISSPSLSRRLTRQ